MSVSVLVSVSTKCFCICLNNFRKTSFILAQVTNACWYCDISRVEYFLEFTLRQSKPTGTHISSPLLGVRSAWARQSYCWHYVGFARMLEPAKFGFFRRKRKAQRWSSPFKHQTHKMFKRTQKIRWQRISVFTDVYRIWCLGLFASKTFTWSESKSWFFYFW